VLSDRAKSPITILLIDDHPYDAYLCAKLCQDASPDINVHHSSNGSEALDYLDQGAAGNTTTPRPDLVVLDLKMPVMNRHTFLEEVNQHDHFGLIPVIVLSVSDRETDIQGSYRNLASGYLVKPETLDGLEGLIQVVMSFRQGTVRLPTIDKLN